MGRGIVLVGCLVVTMLAYLGGAAPTEYIVGGSRGWTASPNITIGYYDKWAANKTFKGGDSLRFELNGTHNVANVSREDYDNCIKTTTLAFSGNSWYILTLPENANGTNYYISTVNSDCENGQKLAINFVSLTSAGSLSSSASSITAVALSVLVLSIIAMFRS
ncbi:hypothetical protein BT93_C2376 [Corymbia citriodora subsp. variegata]|nr:hypothetical protein BT93_C2376 [Corymbia citriodora subsp. variegata]